MPIRFAASTLFVTVSLGAATARAADPPPRILARLDYQAPRDQCPAESALRKEVELRLGYDPFTADAPMRVVAHIEHRDHTLSTEVEAFTGTQKEGWGKSLHVGEGSCGALVTRMGIAISFYLDPLIFSAEPPAQPAPAARPPDPPAPPRRDPLKLSKEKPRVSFEIGLGPQLAVGATGPGLSLLGHLGARWSMLSLGLELRYDARRSMQLNEPFAEVRLDAGALGGTLAPCVHLSDFFGCALLSGGQITVGAIGLEKPGDPPGLFYLGIGPRLGFEKRFLPWLGLRLQGEALVMLQTFDLSTEIGALGVPSPLASRVNGAVGAHLLAYFSP